MIADVLDEPASLLGSSSRDFVARSLWDRLVARITREAGVDARYAERIMDQAIGFLRLCAARSDRAYGPSPTVDVGWHTFILYTKDYADFCTRVAGQFIHHWPTDGDDDLGGGVASDTVAAMRECGIPVDVALWDASPDCTNGHKGSGGDCIKPPQFAAHVR